MNNKIYVEMTDEEYEGFKKMKRGELVDIEKATVIDLLTAKCGKGIERESEDYMFGIRTPETVFKADNGLTVHVKRSL